jgi:long-chain fatty acid transport protein
MSKKAFILLSLILLVSSSLWAGGWNNTLMGCRAMAIGAAFVAVADDPSAIFYNPAGLVFQENNLNFSIDGFYIWPDHVYIVPTGSKTQSKYDVYLPQIFISYRTSDKLTLGFGIYVPYAGGGVDWKEGQAGYPFKIGEDEYSRFKSTLGIYTLTPTLAYQFSEKLSIGFKLNFYRSVLNIDALMDPDTKVITEESGSTISAGFGLMFKPTERIGIGLGIRGPSRMNLSGETRITQTQTIPGFGTVPVELRGDSETSFKLPWDVELGFSYKISENLLFSTSAQYTMWSRLKNIDKKVTDLPYGTPDIEYEEAMDFKNIFIFRSGVEYAFPQGVFLRGGLGFDRSATPESTLDCSNIDVNKFTILGGIGYRTGRTQIDFVYVYAIGKERQKDSAECYNLNVFIMGLGVTFSF